MPDTFGLSMLNDVATYWAPSGHTGFGGRTYATPVAIACKWDESNELFISKQGQETVSQAIVYVDRDLSPDGYLLHGTSVGPDPTAVAGAFEIRKWQNIADLAGVQFSRTAYL